VEQLLPVRAGWGLALIAAAVRLHWPPPALLRHARHARELKLRLRHARELELSSRRPTHPRRRSRSRGASGQGGGRQRCREVEGGTAPGTAALDALEAGGERTRRGRGRDKKIKKKHDTWVRAGWLWKK